MNLVFAAESFIRGLQYGAVSEILNIITRLKDSKKCIAKYRKSNEDVRIEGPKRE